MDSIVKVETEAVKAVVKALPAKEITKALEPSIQNVGRTLETLTGSINVLLFPLWRHVAEYDFKRQEFLHGMAERLKAVPDEQLVTPNLRVAHPILQDAALCSDEPSLRDMYTSLLAASMDKLTASLAHPAFAEVIRQLSSDEALILKRLYESGGRTLHMNLLSNVRLADGENTLTRTGSVVMRNFTLLPYEAACKSPELAPAYIDNLCRLGLTEIPMLWLDSDYYVPLKEHPVVLEAVHEIVKTSDREPAFDKHIFQLTAFGEMFCDVTMGEHADFAVAATTEFHTDPPYSRKVDEGRQKSSKKGAKMKGEKAPVSSPNPL